MDYHFEFRPEEMSLYQTDENQRAAAFKVYVDAGIKQSVAAEMLGLDLPEGIEYADLDPEEKPIPPALLPFTGQQNNVANPAATPEPPTQEAPREPAPTPAKTLFNDELIKTELRTWERFAINAIKGGNRSPSTFVWEYLPDDLGERVRLGLATCDSLKDIKTLFNEIRHDQFDEGGDPILADIRDELRRANDLLEATA